MGWVVGLLTALLIVAVLILFALAELAGRMERFRRTFIAAMGDDDQVYLRTLAQKANDEPYR